MNNNTIKSNRVIAEFMGWKVYVNEGPILLYYFPQNETGEYKEGCKTMHIVNLNYNGSWDWLIPVCIKLNELGYNVSVNNPIQIERVYQDVYYAISHYNTYKK